MALGRGLTSVRGNRGKNCEKWTAGSPKKHIKKHIPRAKNWEKKSVKI
jgi:hypothetical protein